ncbi:chitinase 1 [Striga asiatica]|uniref:Chitinase 1 n=1 Tax=Striga asiatica TaxID=4170 RepID=A0A5A7RBU2_STRAF|nr:chitinase 1 [Striga asiatica]
MKSPKLSITFISTFIFHSLILLRRSAATTTTNSAVFREYIGAEFKNVKFSDVPINPGVEFHFILSFAIDYTTNLSYNPSPTNGKFNIFWDSENLTPDRVSAVIKKHPNVKVAVSLGGDSVGKGFAYFKPRKRSSWLSNAVSTLTTIIEEYNLSGIDIDYEHFNSTPETFAYCVGELVSELKRNGKISFASIAPFDDPEVQKYYTTLWEKYGHVIDYVNFQFYAYDNHTSVSQFVQYFDKQRMTYTGGKVLTSFISDGSRGLIPSKGFFEACKKIKKRGELYGIFVWCADDSKKLRFKYEIESQKLLASP